MPEAEANPGTNAPPVPVPRKRRWLGRLGYLLFLVVFVEVAFQAYYRLTTGGFLFNRVGPPMFVEEPHAGWGIKPNMSIEHITPEFKNDVFTNSLGFRVSAAHEEYSPGRDPSRYRIMFLGPSLSFGWGVNHEDTFAAQLQTRLRQTDFAAPKKVEVVNCGVPAMPQTNQMVWFKNVGKKYEPDLVVQFVYGTMAIDPSIGKRIVRDGYLFRNEPTLKERAISYGKNSAIVFYSWTVLTKLRATLSPPPAAGSKIEGAGRDMSVPDTFNPASNEVVESMKFYEDLRATVDATGSRLLVVYFPLAYTVHREDLSRWKHMGVHDVEQQVVFDRAFVAYLNDHGIACLNLTPYLIEEAQKTGKRLYYWLDVHWTVEGNHAIARVVTEYLLARREWGMSRQQ